MQEKQLSPAARGLTPWRQTVSRKPSRIYSY